MHCTKDETQIVPTSGKYRCPQCKTEYDLKNEEIRLMLRLDNLRKKIVDKMLERAVLMKSKTASKTEIEKMNGMVNRLLSRYNEVVEGK